MPIGVPGGRRPAGGVGGAVAPQAGCAQRPPQAPREVKLSEAGAARKRALALSLQAGGRSDGRTDGSGPAPPLPGPEARAAAELNEELALTQPLGLHHLAEGLVRWGERGAGQTRGAVGVPARGARSQAPLTVAAGVVGDARGAQLREARFAAAAVPAGALAAQTVLVAPVGGHGGDRGSRGRMGTGRMLREVPDPDSMGAQARGAGSMPGAGRAGGGPSMILSWLMSLSPSPSPVLSVINKNK